MKVEPQDAKANRLWTFPTDAKLLEEVYSFREVRSFDIPEKGNESLQTHQTGPFSSPVGTWGSGPPRADRALKLSPELLHERANPATFEEKGPIVSTDGSLKLWAYQIDP